MRWRDTAIGRKVYRLAEQLGAAKNARTFEFLARCNAADAVAARSLFEEAEANEVVNRTETLCLAFLVACGGCQDVKIAERGCEMQRLDSDDGVYQAHCVTLVLRGSDAGTTRSRVHALLTRLCGTLGRVQGDGGQRVAGNRLHHLAPERQPSGAVSEGDPEVCHLGAAYITVNPILERSNLATKSWRAMESHGES